ncbi:MAG: hypothetical protein IKK83_01010 [Clostridia bacterium]|nr:hypothetical protein [Clostridia bacterium]
MKIAVAILLLFTLCFTAACGSAIDGASSAEDSENSVDSSVDSSADSSADSAENSTENSAESGETSESAEESVSSESSESWEESVEIGQTEPYGTLPVRVDVEPAVEDVAIEGLRYNNAIVEHFTFHDALASYYLTYREMFDLDAEDGFAARMKAYNDSYFENKALVLILFCGDAGNALTVKSVLKNQDGGLDIELCRYVDPEAYGDLVYSYLFLELPEGMGTDENTEISLTVKRDRFVEYDPTLRPVVDNAKWAELNPPEEYPVEYQSWRIYTGDEFIPNISLVRSVEELEEYRNAEKYGYEMLHAIERYDEAYFKEQVLVVVYIYCGSGTPRFKPLGAKPDGEGGMTLKICEYQSDEGTADEAEWLILVEPMKGVSADSADNIILESDSDYLENYLPEHPVYHGYAEKEQIKEDGGEEFTEDVEVTVSYTFGPDVYVMKGAVAAELAELLSNLDYKAEELCRCPATTIVSFEGREYGLSLSSNRFVRCEEGQVSLTKAQIDRIYELIQTFAQ